MPKISPIQEAFNSGELDFSLRGRFSGNVSGIRNTGLEEMTNFMPLVQGPASYRGGTHYIEEVKDSANQVRLVSFQFNSIQGHILEFGALYIRVYFNRSLVMDSGSPYEITTPYTQEEISQLQFAQKDDIMLIFHPTRPTQQLTRRGLTDWTLEEFEFRDGPYLTENAEEDFLLDPSGTTGSVTITATGTGNEPFASTDVGRQIRLTHEIDDGGVIKQRSGWGRITAFTSSTVVTVQVESDFGSGGTTSEWRLGAFSETTGYPITGAFGANSLFVAGSLVELQQVWKSVLFDFHTFSPTEIDDGQVTDDLGFSLSFSSNEFNQISTITYAQSLFVGTSGSIWELRSSSGAYTPTDSSYRRVTSIASSSIQPVGIGPEVAYVQKQNQRIYSVRYNPDTVDAFTAIDLTQLSERILKAGVSAIAYQEQPNSTIWAVRNDGLLIGLLYDTTQRVTAWYKYQIGGSFQGMNAIVEDVATISSDRFDEIYIVVKRTINGSTKRYVERLDEGADYKDGFQFYHHVDSGLMYNQPKDVVTITTGTTTTVEVTSHGFSNDDIVCFTDVIGLETPDTGFEISDTTQVRSQINNIPFRIANVTTDTFEIVGLDSSGLTQYGSGGLAREHVSTITGLDHLEGETVSVVVDGAVHPDRVVSSGEITLNFPAAIVIVGLSYRGVLKTFSFDSVVFDGQTQSKRKRPFKLSVDIENSGGARYGASGGRLYNFIFRRESDRMDIAVPLFSGRKLVNIRGGYRRNSSIYIVQEDPLPFNLISIGTEINLTS